LISVGLIFAITPNLFDSIINFLQDFNVETVPNTPILLPAPHTPSAHTVVYSAVGLFSLIWGILEIVFLALRFISHSPFEKKAENASNIAFWLGASYLINTMLTSTMLAGPRMLGTWFGFWAAIIMLTGVTLVIRASILAIGR
jgi:hypothetical protein